MHDPYADTILPAPTPMPSEHRDGRVALWSTGYFRGVGGAEQIVGALLHGLDRAGVDTALIADGPSHGHPVQPYLPPLPPTCRVHTDTFPNPLLVRGRPLAFARALGRYVAASVRLVRFFTRVRPALVHQHLVSLDVFLLILYKQWFGYRLVVTFCGSDVAAAEHSRLARLRIRAALRWADVAIGVSRPITHVLRDRFGAAGATWIPNGVDFATIARARAACEPSVEPDHFVYCGRLHPVKRLPLLIDVFRRCVEAGSDRNLYLVGDGPERDAVRTLIDRHALGDRILLVGTLPRERALRAIAHARCLLLFSRSEGCPNVVLEAAAAGVPVIAAGVGGVPDLVVHGHTGYVFPPADADGAMRHVLRLATDAPHAAALGRNGAAFVRDRFNLDTAIARYRALYDSVLEPRPTARRSIDMLP